MVVHQLIPSFVSGDAMGQAAIHFQVLLRRLGHFGELYAGEVERGLSSLVRRASELRPAKEDWVLYHHGIASGLSSLLLHLDCRRGVVYHNVTPARFYAKTALVEALESGRAQLAAMAPHVDLAIGVSAYNERELAAAGYANRHVVPLFVEPSRFGPDRADPRASKRLGGFALRVLSVSRVAAHKRFEDLLSLHAELRKLRPDARLILVGGYDAGGAYFRALRKEARRLGNVEFWGRVSHGELVAAYRGSSVFVSMSEHEGFGVPLLEAMASDLPVLAYAAAAVPETLGGRGIAFSEKRFGLLAELVKEVAEDARLRKALVRGQRARLVDFSARAAERRLEAALMSVAPARPRPKAPNRRPRVGLVVQRYGDVGGGAEKHAQQIACRLGKHWDVRVLTTCAKDHLTWANSFAAGKSRRGMVEVLRFPTEASRQMDEFNALSHTLFGRSNDRVREEHWLAEQGPRTPGLLRHLATEGHRYDGFVFFTYLYAPTAWGLPLVADRSILVPTAHDEEPFRFDLFRDVFELPRAIFCNTPEEGQLVHQRFPHHAPMKVVGVGVDPPAADPGRFRKKFGLSNPYMLYVGRLEAGKGVGELLDLYARIRRGRPDLPLLLLAGQKEMELRGHGVRYLGRLTEQEKFDGLAGATAAVVPSRFESLSLLCLEAFSVGTPVLVNGRSPVLAGQVARSRAGATYEDPASFADGLKRVEAQRQVLGAAGRRFAKRHTWSSVVDTYLEEMEKVIRTGHAASRKGHFGREARTEA